ncbi:hypothetical protein DLE01_34505 [Streptomyces sp. FT05W]|uniref:hypothetical protein n=1 Tax=Streptomyces TaxID=1883 RepID=UPI000D700878|nr:hypothetical protein [Streptomyces sp. FT05W]PWS46441.1 hypothetical protein DLE01_34505 [Streptomyces sp. FT05W]
MKFDMGASVLTNLMSRSSESSTDLGTLINQLIQAAQPLEGKFNGAGKAAFDSFKMRSDEITAALNGSLAALLGGQSGMDAAFGEGDQEQGENARTQMASANFDAARFSGRG